VGHPAEPNGALVALTDPDVGTGLGVSRAASPSCRLWLGLDDDARPIAIAL